MLGTLMKSKLNFEFGIWWIQKRVQKMLIYQIHFSIFNFEKITRVSPLKFGGLKRRAWRDTKSERFLAKNQL